MTARSSPWRWCWTVAACERQFDLATEVQTAGDETIKIQRVIDEQGHARAAQHDPVKITQDASGTKVGAITWTQRVKPGSAITHPGVYCLRTTLVEPNNATLWRRQGADAGAGVDVDTDTDANVERRLCHAPCDRP